MFNQRGGKLGSLPPHPYGNGGQSAERGDRPKGDDTMPVRRVDRDAAPAAVVTMYRWASAIAICGNVGLLLAKAIVSRQTGSAAIFADAANSAADVGYSILMTVGLWLSVQPPDERHPHGHQRIESLVSMGIGMLMTVAGYESLRVSVGALRVGSPAITSPWALVVLGIAGILKGLMYYAVVRLGRATRSPALAASAQDNLNDLISSGTALVGILLNRSGWHVADPIAGLLVGLWIIRSVWQVLSTSIGQLIGEAASAELSQQIEEAISGVPGVLAVEQVIVEYVGPRVRADIHVNMHPDLTLREIHRASHAVRQAVEDLDPVEHAFIHVEPYWLIDQEGTG